jgi:hypothetical protein
MGIYLPEARRVFSRARAVDFRSGDRKAKILRTLILENTATK